MSAEGRSFDTYMVHAHLYRAEDDEPPEGVSLMLPARVQRTADPEADETRAELQALARLRPYLNNSTHVKTLVVLT